MPTRVRSFSKINLGLAVGPSRPDGFHALTTCYQTLAAHDVVTVTARPAPQTRVTLTANHPGVPRTETGDAEKNTAFRIVAGALERLGVTAQVSIDLDKRLPVQGGLGAGSANAAAALLALERELSSGAFGASTPQLDPSARLALAAEVGSDVPLFLLGGTVLGLNRGEQVYPLPDLPATPCVLALPQVGVSTAAAFRELDAQMAAAAAAASRSPAATSGYSTAPGLTQQLPVDKLQRLSHALATVLATRGLEVCEPGLSGIARSETQEHRGDLAENPLLALVRTGIENDFEEVAFSQHPSLRSIKRDLLGSGPEAALYAALSGSGSALFGLYASEADALRAQQRVQQGGTRAIVTTTLPRSRYWHTMFAE